ncbi:Alpha/Beta hydrolase protein [Sparassis latifolia]
MTLLCSMMRDVARHSHLADVFTIRMLMNIGGYVPVPSDALVTPVTFRVRKRRLRGILKEFDAVEDGTRELSGEWVVGKRTWHRQQQAWRAEHASPTIEKPSDFHEHQKERVVLYLHGGAYYMLSSATHRLITIPLAKHLDARLFALDYRLAPETRFPGPLHDAVSAYFRFMDDLRIPPENIIIAGDSAGGGLALAMLMYLRDNDYPLPSSAILFSPWVDLTLSCDSWDSNAPFDYVPMPQPGDHMNPIACYLGEHMEKYLTHPYASPLFGEFRGLPPMLIQAGDAEVLRDEITLLAHKASLAGVEIRHELYEDAVHVFQTLPFLDASRRAFSSCRDFIRSFLPRWQTRSPQDLEGSAEFGLAREIDNDETRVVRGDGTETGTGLDSSTEGRGLSEKRAKRDLTPPSREEDASWAVQWLTPPTPPTTPDNDKEKVVPIKTDGQKAAVYTLHEARSPALENASLRRLQSTVSMIADASFRSASDLLRRSPSYPDLGDARGSQQKHSPTSRYLVSSMSISSANAPAPKTSIRRSEFSHPDISSLCMQYASSGPAHQTLTFKPDPAPKRGRSKTVSSSSSKDML